MMMSLDGGCGGGGGSDYRYLRTGRKVPYYIYGIQSNYSRHQHCMNKEYAYLLEASHFQFWVLKSAIWRDENKTLEPHSESRLIRSSILCKNGKFTDLFSFAQ